MRLTLRAWLNAFCSLNGAAFIAAFLSLSFWGGAEAFAQEGVLPFDETQEMALTDSSSVDSVSRGSAVMDSVATDSALAGPVSSDSVSSASIVNDSSAVVTPALPKTVKNVLYLGGGDLSPWYHLGVLYAIEEFGIPVDSVVATSWGAWVGALWAKGVSPDEIQRIMLDSTIAPYVGRNLTAETAGLSQEGGDAFEWALSEDGIPSLRKRFSVSRTDDGHLVQNRKPLVRDSVPSGRALAKLRFQESLYRQPIQYARPFSLVGCDENATAEFRSGSVDEIIKSLPLWGNDGDVSVKRASGELCPFYALPAEDRLDELSIIVVADPLRNSPVGDVRNRLLRKMESAQLSNQPGVIIRSHAISDTSRNAWIQAGFSAVEQRRTSHPALSSRKVDYGNGRRPAAKSWFRFSPSLDSLRSSIHAAVRSYWNEADTGLAGPRNFAGAILKNPAYDSLDFFMGATGDLFVETVSHPTFDLAVGGFGSNVVGPQAYAEGSVRYVDHVELQLTLAGFWGGNSYGVMPRLDISKLLGLGWGVSLDFAFLRLQPLRSYYNSLPWNLKVGHEERMDLNLSMYYEIDSRQKIAAEFLFGSRTYELDTLHYRNGEVVTYPVSPMLHYSYESSGESGWFAEDGAGVDVMAGMESIGYRFDIMDLVPIYWKILVDGRLVYSPHPNVSLGIGVAGGIERYHEDGFGYVSPKSFECGPLDLAYRLHAQATPWSTEWYNRELSSHEYGMLRANGGVHGKHLGAWIFAAYYHDFEDSPLAELDVDKFVVEPAVRFVYKSMVLYMGLNRIVDKDSFKELRNLSDYSYFIRVGNYSF